MHEDVKKIFVQIAVALPISGTFTYTVKGDLINNTGVGKRVLVSFSGRNVTGYILRIIPPEHRKGLKDITAIIDSYPLFPPNMVKFFEWISEYYRYPIGLVIKTALPTGLNVTASNNTEMPLKGWLDRVGVLKKVFIALNEDAAINRSAFVQKKPPINEAEFMDMMVKKKEVPLSEIKTTFSNGVYLVNKWIKMGLLSKSLRPVARKATDEILFISHKPPALNSKQKEVLEKISEKLKHNSFFTYLLHGVTGSGKTEVYYHAVKFAQSLGKQSIIMVPEIALAFSLASLFRARLGNNVAILHSALSPGERYDQWIKTIKGEADVVIGARSALFAPFSRLGLIIIDEEHDPSYKQEDKCRYQARDAAIVRAKLLDALVVLGSGTPSVQSYQNAVSGKYGLLTMSKRIFERKPPDITMIDMKNFEHSGSKADDRVISPPLMKAIQENLAQERQSILFLNRRGFSSLYLCRLCGETLKCPNCEVSLTYHKYGNNLLCHYCGFRIQPPHRCPSCNRETLKPYGFGTEKVVETIKEVFPEARVERMDRDTMRHKGDVQQVLKRFLHHKADILVGTQMVTKGHDFPNVTLVGVISADMSLNFPDFRAGENTFQLLSQVAGRTGRGNTPGKVIIQTFNPSHYAINAARDHDYQKFFLQETRLRRELNYPPFSFIANVRFHGNNKTNTQKIAQLVGEKISSILKNQLKGEKHIEILGPVEAPLARLKGKYRQQILIKAHRTGQLNRLLKEIENLSGSCLSSSGVKLIIDVDPYNMV
ncbi:MAG TPA: primosomal protein N' [Desulfatiglandales bacterium]|nr:primosomal protein N' [Desulfatiglandales bacterium]